VKLDAAAEVGGAVVAVAANVAVEMVVPGGPMMDSDALLTQIAEYLDR
jgi:hypothetical protein